MPDRAIDALAPRMRDLLRELIATPSVSGEERGVVESIARYASAAGLQADLWCATDDELARHGSPLPSHRPFIDRPTLMITLAGSSDGPSLLFNAHSDVVSPGDRALWSCDPWRGDDRDGEILGRGACDDKGPLISALWAMLAMKEAQVPLAGDVRLEIVPGEEDCVGLGTLSSVLRGHRADAAIILEPTENIPRCASRPGLRFVITLTGRAVHGTVKWLGIDAIAQAHRAMTVCDELQTGWNDRNADPLFAGFPFARPITIDSVHGGEWQGMVCDRCTIAGYLELLPLDDIDAWANRFREMLTERLVQSGVESHRVRMEFPERYAGHRTDPGSAFCRLIETTLHSNPETAPLMPSPWCAFNSGCEAGVRFGLHGTPTVVWGPGSLAHAHAPDERVRFEDVHLCARAMARVSIAWCNGKDSA